MKQWNKCLYANLDYANFDAQFIIYHIMKYHMKWLPSFQLCNSFVTAYKNT